MAPTVFPPGLPVPWTSLVGREMETAACRGFLLDAGTPLLTLTGPGGVGKTRLAFAVAAEVAGAFADGLAVVDIAPLTAPEHVVPAMARAVGVAEVGRRR